MIERPPQPTIRPSLRRQALFAVVTFAAVIAGYFGASMFRDDTPREAARAPQPTATPAPWYRTQAPPPQLVTSPDRSLFPDPHPDGNGLRAYEEALPEDIYLPPPPKPAPPVSPLPAPALQPEPPADVAALPPPRPAAQAPLVHAPALPAPAIGSGTPAWRRFAQPAPAAKGLPRVALVIDDMGVDRNRSARIVGLPPPLTVSFLSYARDLGEQAAAARAAGHEILLHVPMEPAGDNDAGPGALTTALGADEIRERLAAGLSRYGAFVGINNHMGSRFTTDPHGMTVVMEELRKRGLLFLDSRTAPNTVGATIARHLGIASAERNVFLDNVNDMAAIQARLDETERIARRHGFAIAIGHPRDATVEAIKAWLPGAGGRGLVLVPLSAVTDPPTAIAAVP